MDATSQLEMSPGAREGLGIVGPFRQLRLPRGLRIPRPLGALLALAAASGPIAALRMRGSLRERVFRAIHLSAGLAYAVIAALDLREHFRLEKEVTGHALRWTAVPLDESAVHAGIIATNLSAIVLARPVRRPHGFIDRWLLVAPAVFLALGLTDEVVYHRRRAPHRESIIHATEHLAEGVMWTTLYASRLTRRARRRWLPLGVRARFG